PRQPGLGALENQEFKQLLIVPQRNTPFLVVILHVKRIVAAPLAAVKCLHGVHPGRQKKAPDRGDDAGHISAVLMVIVIIGVEPLLLSRVWIVLLKMGSSHDPPANTRSRLVKRVTTTSG